MARSFLLPGTLVAPLYTYEGYGENVCSSHCPGPGGMEDRKRLLEEKGLPEPKNYTIASTREGGRVRAVFHGIDRGHLLIRAPNLRRAYELARSVTSALSLLDGHAAPVQRDHRQLIEVARIPQPAWSDARLMESLLDPIDRYALCGGVVLSERVLAHLKPYVQALEADENVRDALCHLGHSRHLFYGFMVGSYYAFHYRGERQELSRHDLERDSFENRESYELSFLSAFKGLERFLGVNQIRKSLVQRAFSRLPYPGCSGSEAYRRWHEIFSGWPKRATYQEMTLHFLDIRNAVAAHGNRKPPRGLLCTQDSVYEIQHFLAELCAAALDGLQPEHAQGAVQMARPPRRRAV